MKVTHVKERKFTVYIGRPTVYGNPFIIGRDGTRKEVIKKFRRYAIKTKRVREAIIALPTRAILGCHCSPKSCHGDVIIALHRKFTRKVRP